VDSCAAEGWRDVLGGLRVLVGWRDVCVGYSDVFEDWYGGVGYPSVYVIGISWDG
jgi:hypothetical protein